MSTPARLLDDLGAGRLDSDLLRLYPSGRLDPERARMGRLLEGFRSRFPADLVVDLYSAPGRTELGGNHTDHNGGRVLAGAVTLDAVAVASPARDIRIHSEGYGEIVLDPEDLAKRANEEHTPAAVVRGVIARLKVLGHAAGGFHAVVHSRIPEGSGLSSSASFEVLVATVQNHLYNRGVLDPVLLAQVGQHAENVYFGKPSGLMDQTASAVGGVVCIDFRDPDRPDVRKVRPPDLGVALMVVNTGGNHAGLTAEYAAIRAEMESVARALGGRRLGDVEPNALRERMNAIREKTGDRALLRALHFYGENDRVLEQARALEGGDIPAYLKHVNESGLSSWTLNQNCYAPAFPRTQPIPLALTLSQGLLRGRGACRVHGGGFAGTIQAYVPRDLAEPYEGLMRQVFGPDACTELTLRERGACRILTP